LRCAEYRRIRLTAGWIKDSIRRDRHCSHVGDTDRSQVEISIERFWSALGAIA
jgi:hypothetical protein